MESVNLSPTVNFGDSFALSCYLPIYQQQYDKFTICLYNNDSNSRKITCNYPALLRTLAGLRYDNSTDVYVFGHTKEVPFHSVMIFELTYDFINDYPIIKLF